MVCSWPETVLQKRWSDFVGRSPPKSEQPAAAMVAAAAMAAAATMAPAGAMAARARQAARVLLRLLLTP